ncbi:MAG: hypothetical protein F6K58_22980 [Symploca sp. SIO2E9]|nr:hypothetical protein [Symploca sp. SIO2E9]
MSEDQKQPPVSSEESGEWLEANPEIAQTTRKRKQTFFKAQTIKVLRGTIGILEGVVERLEKEPVPELAPASKSVSTSSSELTTETPEPDFESSTTKTELATTTSDTPTTTPEITAAAIEEPQTEPVAEPTSPQLFVRLLPSFNSLEAFWSRVLLKARSLMPAAWSEKLSDWGLTGAIASSIVIILLTTVALLPKTPAQEAKAPPNRISAPPELKAPQPPEVVEVEPPPPPKLTPEESLVVAVQNQVAEITNQYGEGLIKSINANFLASILAVQVGNGWYQLPESQQDKLADGMLSRSRELDFSKLEITDIEGILVARTPVVGSHMVILRRQ